MTEQDNSFRFQAFELGEDTSDKDRCCDTIRRLFFKWRRQISLGSALINIYANAVMLNSAIRAPSCCGDPDENVGFLITIYLMAVCASSTQAVRLVFWNYDGPSEFWTKVYGSISPFVGCISVTGYWFTYDPLMRTYEYLYYVVALAYFNGVILVFENYSPRYKAIGEAVMEDPDTWCIAKVVAVLLLALRSVSVVCVCSLGPIAIMLMVLSSNGEDDNLSCFSLGAWDDSYCDIDYDDWAKNASGYRYFFNVTYDVRSVYGGTLYENCTHTLSYEDDYQDNYGICIWERDV